MQDAACPKVVLHRGKIDYFRLADEFDNLVDLFKKLKIKVHFIDPRRIKGTDERYIYNLIYARDLFFMTPRGAVLSQMGAEVRRDEARYAERALLRIKAKIRTSIQGHATFEGADALWVTDKLVIVGVGKRTNAAGFSQLKKELSRDDVSCVPVPAPRASLHLLGALQFVDANLAVARAALLGSQIRRVLKKNRIEVVDLGETREVVERQAMNFVTIAPRKIIMPANCPSAKKIYLSAGINVTAEVETKELVKGAGGLACATGILSREALS